MSTRRSRRATALLALAVTLVAAGLVIFGGERGPPPGASRQAGNAAASAQDAASAMLGGAAAPAAPTALAPPTPAEPTPASADGTADADAVFAAIDVQLARVADGIQAQRLESPATTRIGDRLRIGISNNRDLYVYAFNQELGGMPTVMFPLAVLDLKNPLLAGEHELPGTVQGAHQSYTVESRAASEEILLVLATAPLPLLDAHVAAMAAVAAGDATASPTAGSSSLDLERIAADAARTHGKASKLYRWRLDHEAAPGG